MYEIRNILVPLDLADSNQMVVPYIRSLVMKHNSSLHLLYIFHSFGTRWLPVYSYDLDMDAVNGYFFIEAQKSLTKFAADNFKGLPRVHTIVKMGFAGRSILDYSERNYIDLIVLGNRVSKENKKRNFKKVTDEILEKSSIPVLVINPLQAQSH